MAALYHHQQDGSAGRSRQA